MKLPILLTSLWIAAVILVTPVMAQSDQLRSLADARGKRIGTAVNTNLLANDARFRDFVGSAFSSVTPENVMKWQLVERARGNPDYSAADQLVEFARAHNQTVRGHTLVWHRQLPTWLTTTGFTDAELADVLQAHIVDEAAHFAGELYAWDVVNEPFNEDGSWRDSIWYQTFGTSYVAAALKWAHEADPAAKLYINDYNIEAINPKSDALYALARDLLANGAPLDGVGVQAHLAIQNPYPESLTANLQRFTDLGLEVAITEADVRMTVPANPDKLAIQAEYYRNLLQSCLSVERCVSFTVWGFADSHSWVPNAFNGQGAATLLDEAFNPKPAYWSVRETLVSP